MSSSNGRLGQLFLRYAAPLAGIRSFPIIGPIIGWAGAKLVPRDSMTWVQIRKGPAQGLWLHLNPRTGRNYFEGGGEPEVQAALLEQLRPGILCEMHSEENRRFLLEEFSRFGYMCKALDENHVLALPK